MSDAMRIWGEAVRARAGNRCELCGYGPGPDHDLEAAHILSRGAHPALKYEERNGFLAGRSCHRRLDANRKSRLWPWVESRWPGLLVYLRQAERMGRVPA